MDALTDNLAGLGEAGEGEETSPGVRYAYQEGKAITKVRYSHDAMIDMIIANPWVSQNHLAQVFGYTPAWVSLVMSSDAFKERLAARKAELVDPALVASIEERFRAMVTRSLEVLQEKLSAPASVVPDNLALRAVELGAKALGLGGNAPPPPVQVPSDHLDKLAQRLVALQQRSVPSGVVYEVQVEDAQVVPAQ
jgi:hypothetical protein